MGLDCEMVGTGPSGKTSVLARCCLVNFEGEVIYDNFVRPSGTNILVPLLVSFANYRPSPIDLRLTMYDMYIPLRICNGL